MASRAQPVSIAGDEHASLWRMPSRHLWEVHAWSQSVGALATALHGATGAAAPTDMCRVTSDDAGVLVLQLGPQRWWVLASPGRDVSAALMQHVTPDIGSVVDLAHARKTFQVRGLGAAGVVARLSQIETHHDAFAVGAFAQTGIHHVGVLIMAVSDEGGRAFDILVPTTFAFSLRATMQQAVKDEIAAPAPRV
ncbi:MAG: hypothetical protein AAFR04_00530 [Pseudomonadota bacterium]